MTKLRNRSFNLNEDSKTQKRLNRIAIVQYTILFSLLVLLIYAVLIINHRSFIKGGDGLKQGYFWTVELKHYIETLLEGKGLTLWSWSKLLGMSVPTARYWDPFNWIAAAFPVGYIELGYTITALLRMYCGGLAFLALMRYSGLRVFAGVFGAVLYAFSGYSIVLGLEQADFLINLYLFPLLVITVEMIYKGKSPAFFSIRTGLYLISYLYSAFMAAVSIILYIVLRYFAYNEFSVKGFAINLGKFVFYGVVGICIGCIQLLPDYKMLSMASTESSSDRLGLLFNKGFYYGIGEKLIGIGDVKNYSIMGWTSIAIILLVLAILKLRLKKTPLIMTIILFAGAMMPVVCSMYNAFGYPTHRWVFAIELFAMWTVASEIDEADLLSKRSIAVSIIALGGMAFLTIGLNHIYNLGYSNYALAFVTAQLIGGAAFVALIAFANKRGSLRKLSRIAILLIVSLSLGASWTISFIDNQSVFLRNNRINKKLEKSTQRAGALIEDDEFYRIDQVDSISYHLRYPANETLWWQTRSIYTYNSRIPSALLEFNRLLGNNCGYSKRVVMVSNDNRSGLDYLYGVKYFLGDDLKNGRLGADKYAGYGFKESELLDGVRVLKSKYDVSMGYIFDKYITKSDFEKLSYAEREQALLQAVVLPDNAEAEGLTRLRNVDIKTQVKDISYNIVEGDGVKVTDDSIVVTKGGSVLTLEPEDVEDSQLLLSITGLLKDVEEGQSKPFELRIENEYIQELASNKRGNQTIPNIRDYTLNMGYYEKYHGGKIKIRFWSPGTYKYDKIQLTAMNAGLFDETIAELSNKRYNISSFSNSQVEGTVDSEKDGILFLSIIEPERWDCYVDGKKTEIIPNTDIAFAGVEIPRGHHDVSLKLNNSLYVMGLPITIIGLILLAASELIRRRKGPKAGN